MLRHHLPPSSSSAPACRPPRPARIALAAQRAATAAAAASILLLCPANLPAATAAPLVVREFGAVSADALASAPCDLAAVATTLDGAPMLACDLAVGSGPEPLRNALSRVHFTISLGDRDNIGSSAAGAAGAGAAAAAAAAGPSSSSSSSPVLTNYVPPNAPFFTSRTTAGLGGGKPLLVKLGERDGVAAWDDAVLGGGKVVAAAAGGLGDGGGLLPPMREGGVRRVVVPPGPLQRVNAKAMLWQAAELDALDEVGEAASAAGEEAAGAGGGATGFRRDLVFTIELAVAKKR